MMENRAASFLRVLVPALTLVFAAAAQALLPNGTYGFVVAVAQLDSAGANGAALVGLLNFDGTGNLTGTATLKGRDTRPDHAQAGVTAITGTYSANDDGTVAATLNFDFGVTATLVMSGSDGGQVFRFIDTGCAPCGANFPLRGQPGSLTGGLPVGMFWNGAAGSVPLTLTGVSNDGVTVYTATPAGGSGTAQCPDGSSGTWSGGVPALTVVVNPDIPSMVQAGGAVAGNFFAAVIGNSCDNNDFETTSGLVTGTVNPGGTTVLTLHAVTGGVASGYMRAAGGSSLSGVYGVQMSFQPFPLGGIGIMNFDGAGNVTFSSRFSGGTLAGPASNTLTGTYTINPDSTGTLSLQNPAGQPAGTWSFVITGNGSELLLLRTDNNPQFDVSYGTARLQGSTAADSAPPSASRLATPGYHGSRVPLHVWHK